MIRRALLLTLLAVAGVATAAPSLKKLLDPQNPEFPLNPYSWEAWEALDKDKRYRSRGADLSAWEDPPAKTEADLKAEQEYADHLRKKREEAEAKLSEEEKKQRAERRKRQRENFQKQEEKNKKARSFPGFKFEQRLRKKQMAFDTLLDPASPSKLEGMVKQLKLLDRAMDKFQKVIDEVEDEYVKYKEQLDKIMFNKSENYKKRHGKYPSVVGVPAGLQQTVQRNAKKLQRLLSLRQSEVQFQAWIIKRVAKLIADLTPDERVKPVRALGKGITNKDWRYRIRCARLLGHLGDPLSVETFKKAMQKERDPLVLAELVRIRSKRGGAGVMEVLQSKLEDPKWPVRAAAVRALARIRKKQSVDLLVTRMAKEEGRMLDDITDALKGLTGKDYEPKPDPWRIWWDKVKKNWAPPPELKPGETVLGKQDGKAVYFYGIRSSSKRVVFCIDISGSMNFPLDGQGGKKDPRIKRAKKELIQALSALPEDAIFNIVVYSVSVKVWKRRMQTATLKSKQSARKFVEALEPSGGTNIFDALVTSLQTAATAGKKKPKKGEPPSADTIFFLTDGQPTAGRITDPNQIIEEITNRNSLLGLTIHTVGVSREQNAGFLLNLAKRNNGKYVAHK